MVLMTNQEILDTTFSDDSSRLPTIRQIREVVQLDDPNFWGDTIETFRFREKYIRNSFPILTDDFLSFAVDILNDYRVVELACGPGWLTYWLRRYGLEVERAVDDLSWNADGHSTELRYQDWVERGDAVECVRQDPFGLFVMSWPYMDSLAAKVWKSMRRGSVMLYIGEGHGGCTADDEFHELIHLGEVLESETEILEENFVSFWGVHDRPLLVRKTKV